jgi:hypothetical protein
MQTFVRWVAVGLTNLLVILSPRLPFFYLYDSTKMRGAYLTVYAWSLQLNDQATPDYESTGWHELKEFKIPVVLLVFFGHCIAVALLLLAITTLMATRLSRFHYRIASLGGRIMAVVFLFLWWFFFTLAAEFDEVGAGPSILLVLIILVIVSLHDYYFFPTISKQTGKMY